MKGKDTYINFLHSMFPGTIAFIEFDVIYPAFCSCIPDNKEFHSPSVVRDLPYLYCVLSQPGEKVFKLYSQMRNDCKLAFEILLQPLSCPPAMKLVSTQISGKNDYHLLRGDSEGFVTLWTVPDISTTEIKKLQTLQSTPQGGMLPYLFPMGILTQTF